MQENQNYYSVMPYIPRDSSIKDGKFQFNEKW